MYLFHPVCYLIIYAGILSSDDDDNDEDDDMLDVAVKVPPLHIQQEIEVQIENQNEEQNYSDGVHHALNETPSPPPLSQLPPLPLPSLTQLPSLPSNPPTLSQLTSISPSLSQPLSCDDSAQSVVKLKCD